jgi:2-phosphosulfolactate phosphatase
VSTRWFGNWRSCARHAINHIGMFFNQQDYDVRCEWGGEGITQLAPASDAVVIVDVLSFSTCVDIVVGNGGTVCPNGWKDESAVAYAESVGAIMASPIRKSDPDYSLSPTSLLKIPAGSRLVLPSPKGSTLTLATRETPTFTGCLRNATVVAAALRGTGKRISVIPTGEKWEDGSLRPALEDLVGAGAIINQLTGTRSPEAELAVATFLHFQNNLPSCLKQCSSGRELIGRGFEGDVDLAAAMDSSSAAPILKNGAYVKFT